MSKFLSIALTLFLVSCASKVHLKVGKCENIRFGKVDSPKVLSKRFLSFNGQRELLFSSVFDSNDVACQNLVIEKAKLSRDVIDVTLNFIPFVYSHSLTLIYGTRESKKLTDDINARD